MSIFSFLMISLSNLSCFESFLCLIGRRIVLISSFSMLFASLSRGSYGPIQTIGLNFSRSRNLASRYICNSAPPDRGVSVKRRMFFGAIFVIFFNIPEICPKWELTKLPESV